MYEWGIDIFFSGSQKAMMLPPGLNFIAASDRAWKVIEANSQPRVYLDLREYRQKLLADSTPFTPAVSLLFGLETVLNLFENEGLEAVYLRHAAKKEMMRAAMQAV